VVCLQVSSIATIPVVCHNHDGKLLPPFVLTMAASSSIKQELELALESFQLKAALRPEQQAEFKGTDADHVRLLIARIQSEREKTRSSIAMRRLEPFLKAMEQYGKVVEVFTNTSMFVAFVWV
jgi:hypothetical protein